MKKYHFIGAASGWGAQVKGCEDGPESILSSLKSILSSPKTEPIIYAQTSYKDKKLSLLQALEEIYIHNCSLAQKTYETLESGGFPVIFGGDHAIAVGTWNGVYKFYKQNQQLPMGLIWIDAHMDSHTPATSLSGAWHGMPLAGLLGHGVDQFSKLLFTEPVFSPENICLIGVRSYEEGEAKLLKTLNVKTIFVEEVHQKGMAKVMQEALEWITSKTKVFGVSLDLDVMDPKVAPAVGCPEKNGIHDQDLIKALHQLQQYPQLSALEVVEYNPNLDKDNQTLKIIHEILKVSLTGFC